MELKKGITSTKQNVSQAVDRAAVEFNRLPITLKLALMVSVALIFGALFGMLMSGKGAWAVNFANMAGALVAAAMTIGAALWIAKRQDSNATVSMMVILLSEIEDFYYEVDSLQRLIACGEVPLRTDQLDLKLEWENDGPQTILSLASSASRCQSLLQRMWDHLDRGSMPHILADLDPLARDLKDFALIDHSARFVSPDRSVEKLKNRDAAHQLLKPRLQKFLLKYKWIVPIIMLRHLERSGEKALLAARDRLYLDEAIVEFEQAERRRRNSDKRDIKNTDAGTCETTEQEATVVINGEVMPEGYENELFWILSTCKKRLLDEPKEYVEQYGRESRCETLHRIETMLNCLPEKSEA